MQWLFTELCAQTEIIEATRPYEFIRVSIIMLKIKRGSYGLDILSELLMNSYVLKSQSVSFLPYQFSDVETCKTRCLGSSLGHPRPAQFWDRRWQAMALIRLAAVLIPAAAATLQLIHTYIRL